MPDVWDPNQYLRFANERERPFWDLVSHIPRADPRAVIDLGCGPGTATASLLDKWPGAHITGIDSSVAMIDQATARSVPGRLDFVLGDVARWIPEPSGYDVILSNAALHWVIGHVDLFGRWMHGLGPGGVLAFQVPGNFGAPSHTAIAELAASPPWREKLSSVTEILDLHTPAQYHRALRQLGAAVDVWETTYVHALSGPDPVLEWLRGSALRPYLSALDPRDADLFCSSYAEATRLSYPPQPDGTTLLPFRRIFVVATKPS